MDINERAKGKIISIINALMPDARIYLFGSRARGSGGQWSDIDLALDMGERLDYRDLGEVKDLMEALRIPYKVDVVDVHAVSDKMREEIFRDKVEWKA